MDKEIEEKNGLNHCWERQNLITIRYGGKIFDIYKCKYCGITGKRYWKNQYVTRDSIYKSDKYLYCQGQEKIKDFPVNLERKEKR